MSPTGVKNPKTEPTLATYGSELARSILTQLNCHALGQVESFDRARQSCTASVGYLKTLADGKTVEYQGLVDCPVLFLGGSKKGRLTFDVQKGDECLVLFNDRNMDVWVTAGQKKVPETNRLHAFADAIVIVGVRPFCRALDGFLPNGAEFAWGTTSIQLTGTLRLANATTDLRTALNSLVDVLKAMVGQITPTTGMTAGNIAANQAALESWKAALGGLLT